MNDVFSAHAGIYDRARRGLIPCFDEFYGAAARILDTLNCRPERCLDLGAGTGLFSAILSRHVAIRSLVLQDQSHEMLKRGQVALMDLPAVSVVGCRLQDISEAGLELGGFDAVWSALAIHHLDGPEKRVLFRSVHALLRPGGIFINADQSLGPTQRVEAAWRAEWLREVRTSGVTEEDVSMALERMKEDRMDTLSDQLSWLEEAGFDDCSCWFQNFSFTVYAGVRRD